MERGCIPKMNVKTVNASFGSLGRADLLPWIGCQS